MFQVCKECTHAQHCASMVGCCQRQAVQLQREWVSADFKFSAEQSRQVAENMMQNNALVRKVAWIK